ncbi:MAG: hypothetical protein KDA32_05460 [Phycisphaerales bacterium]|nr:hypothetical protein [Phycisphaerales bacterium]
MPADAPSPDPASRSDPVVPRRAPWWMKAIVLVVALALALVGAEFAVRAIPAQTLGFEYADGEFAQPKEFDTDRTVNSLGFHDVEPGPKRDDVRRVLLFGDSYIGDVRHPIPQTPGRRLEHYLNARSPDQEYEVIAIGNGGWGQIDQINVWETTGYKLKPDIVVTLMLTFNDILDNNPAMSRDAQSQKNEMVQPRPGRTNLTSENAPLFWVKGSRLNQLLSHRLARVGRAGGGDSIPLAYEVYALDESEAWAKAWKVTEDCVTHLSDDVRGRGGVCAIVTASTPHGVLGAKRGLEALQAAYPAMKDRRWDLDGPDLRVKTLCERHDIPFLRLESAFREATAAGRELHFKYNGHWNAEGNDFAASFMADFILRIDHEHAAESANRPGPKEIPVPADG